jgi:hypothetical protein
MNHELFGSQRERIVSFLFVPSGSYYVPARIEMPSAATWKVPALERMRRTRPAAMLLCGTRGHHASWSSLLTSYLLAGIREKCAPADAVRVML